MTGVNAKREKNNNESNLLSDENYLMIVAEGSL